MESKFLQDLKDKDSLLTFIKEWNESRLDMFALSQPNEVCLLYNHVGCSATIMPQI